jgi:hypothetical protein
MRNKDFVPDGFLAVTVAGLVPVLELAHSRIYLKTQFASERRPLRRSEVEGYADLLPLTPDDMTGNVLCRPL